MKKYICILTILLTIFLTNCKDEIIIPQTNQNQINETTYYYVDIKGEIILPGVYLVKSNFLIKDVIEMAGGLTPDADISNINLAEVITNNQMIIIPINNNKQIENNSNLININTATKEQLIQLESIGESKANNIIDYITNKGSFKTIEELKNVSGIGNEIYKKIKDFITV